MRKDETQTKDLSDDAVGENPTATPEADTDTELDELSIMRAELERSQAETADFRDRFLRARADLENYRRRAAGDVTRAPRRRTRQRRVTAARGLRRSDPGAQR